MQESLSNVGWSETVSEICASVKRVYYLLIGGQNVFENAIE